MISDFFTEAFLLSPTAPACLDFEYQEFNLTEFINPYFLPGDCFFGEYDFEYGYYNQTVAKLAAAGLRLGPNVTTAFYGTIDSPCSDDR